MKKPLKQRTKNKGQSCCPLSSLFSLFSFLFSLFVALPVSASEIDHLAAFSDPAHIWGNGIERVIEEAYRACFRTKIIGGRIMNIRIPFAENHERDLLSDTGWDFVYRGKGNPNILWPVIEEILDTEEFARYVETLSDEREQVIIFDMATQTWQSSRDLFDVARMKAGSYRGLPHRPYVYSAGKGIEESDVYNYLYCAGHTGMDCSAFVWYVLTYCAQQGGLDLSGAVSRSLGLRGVGDPSSYVGTSFYASKNSQILPVESRISRLRPADIILFTGAKGDITHSAIIQSIDFTRGIIRYLQCTDEAPLHERGVHESFIYFDPEKPNVSLSDRSLNWTQKRQVPFPGEGTSAFPNDGVRFRAFGGGRVVRLRLLVPVIDKLNRQ